MKKLGIIYFLFYSFNFVKGQNLVPNPSFEDTTSISQNSSLIICKTQSCGSVWWCANWFEPTKTNPNYYNKCSGDSQNSVPKNQMGYQFANTGNAYSGIAIYSTPHL